MSPVGVTTRKNTMPITIGAIIEPIKIPNLNHNLFNGVNNFEFTKPNIKKNTDKKIKYILKSSPLFTRAGGFKEAVDHRQHIIFTPPCYISINTTVKSSKGSSEDKVADIRILNALTPETSKTTNYFWNLVRCFAIDDKEMETFLYEGNKFAFSEDQAIIEQQQKMWDTMPSARPIPFPHDKGVIASGRLMERLISEEEKEITQAAE